LGHRELESIRLGVSELNGDILSKISRHRAAEVYRMVQIPKGGDGVHGRWAPPALRSLPLRQRSATMLRMLPDVCVGEDKVSGGG
jgi:hypothetical protein